MNNIKVIKNYIGGKWVETESHDLLDIENPSTGEIIGKVPLSTKAEVNHAVTGTGTLPAIWRNG